MTDRYSRQILFSAIGEAGQKRIKAAKVVPRRLWSVGYGQLRDVDEGWHR